jgi:S-sulfosulfanyl-L-cysteine sulfohydrolase
MAMHDFLEQAGKCVLASALSLALTGLSSAQADQQVITLIQLQDVHGNLAPHAGIVHNPDGTEREVLNGGGLAKSKTLINDIRAENPNNLLLAVGDTVHGTAEVLFTVGDAIMPTLNSFGIDAYTPGNWEFGYGPAVFRNRFTAAGPKPGLPANIQVMAGAVDCGDVPVIPGVTDVPGFCVEMPPSPSASKPTSPLSQSMYTTILTLPRYHLSCITSR